MFNDEIVNKQSIRLTLPSLGHNVLEFKLTNKSSGKNNIWDTEVNDLNEITSDKFIKINNVLLDRVNITTLIYNSPYLINDTNNITNEHHGFLNFNGTITFKYNEPLLSYLINAKYKKPIDNSKSYFSNNTYIFHYTKEIELIEEIKQLLNEL